jgi:hypothetical protein
MNASLPLLAAVANGYTLLTRHEPIFNSVCFIICRKIGARINVPLTSAFVVFVNYINSARIKTSVILTIYLLIDPYTIVSYTLINGEGHVRIAIAVSTDFLSTADIAEFTCTGTDVVGVIIVGAAAEFWITRERTNNLLEIVVALARMK